MLTGIAKVVWQVTIYKKIFEVGSLHLIHGKTTISPVDRGTPEQQHGLPKAAPFRNGNRPDQVPFYGFMGNVSPPTRTLSRRLMVFPPIAGAGKSVLWHAISSIFPSCELMVLSSSTIIENVNSMRKSGLASLAFFYCDFRENEKRDLRGLLSSVLVQLCHQSDSYCQVLSSFYSGHGGGLQDPSDDELTRCLKDILEVPGQAPIYLIVDGLDECSNKQDMPSPREKIIRLFKYLVNLQLPNLRICVTSRPEIDIKDALERLAFRSVSLHDESEQRKDIDDYIRTVINTDPNMGRWKAADKELVIDVLIEKSDGM